MVITGETLLNRMMLENAGKINLCWLFICCTVNNYVRKGNIEMVYYKIMKERNQDFDWYVYK